MYLFWQLLWKEYREQRSFWLGMFVLALLADCAFAWLAAPGHMPLMAVLDVALGAAVLYGAGASSVAFAAEHERGTFAWLRGLPSGPWPIASAKILWGVASSLLLMGALSAVATLFPRPWTEAQDQSMVLRQGFLMLAEALVWGTFCSLLVREPLRAAILTMVLTTVDIHVGAALVPHEEGFYRHLAAYDRASPWRLAVLVLVGAFDTWLIPRWFAAKVPIKLAGRRSKTAGGTAALGRRSLLPRAWNQWVHLAWQGARGSLPTILLLGGLAGVGVALEAVTESRDALEAALYAWTFSGNSSLSESKIAAFGGIALATCCGAFAFRADQHRQSRRFLAERGVSPSLVWLSRQTTWAAVLIIILIALLALPGVRLLHYLDQNASYLFSFGEYSPYDDFVQSIFGPSGPVPLLACIPLAFAAGQLASMFVSQALPAGVLAFVLAGLTSGWTLLMAGLRINYWWSVVPIFAALLAATWLRSRPWLDERKGLAGWLAPIGALVAVASTLGVAVPVYRVYEIPSWQDDRPDVATLIGDTPAGRETLERYVEAYRELAERRDALEEAEPEPEDRDVDDSAPPADSDMSRRAAVARERRLVAESGSVIEAALAASRREECYLPLSLIDNQSKASKSVDGLVGFLAGAGAVRTAEGHLDDAAKAYLGALGIARHLRPCGSPTASWLEDQVFDRLRLWAAHEGQSTERIRSMIASLQAWHASLPPPDAALGWELGFHLAFVDNLDEASLALPAKTYIPQSAWIASRLPWERARARRLLYYQYDDEKRRLQYYLEHFLNVGHSVYDQLREQMDRRRAPYYLQRLANWQASTPLAFEDIGSSVMWDVATDESQYRMAMSMLAILAWKQEHRELPADFEPAAKEYLGTVPIDPFAGQPYLYFSHGVPIPLRERNRQLLLPADQPFLWSVWKPGTPRVAVYVSKDVNNLTEYHRSADYYRGGASRISLYDALEEGEPIAIP